MIVQHKDLAQGRWAKMPLCEQLANVGSEVSRALNWQNKGKDDLSKRAVIRALELLSLTIHSTRKFSHLKELLRTKEALLDYFYGSNQFASSEVLWRKYFNYFAIMARKKRA